MINILIADDHHVLINGLKLILAVRKDFCVMATAGDGEETLLLVEQNHPDIILLDINMPKLNGYQTIKILTSRFPLVKVIALSMLTDRRTVESMLSAGAKGYLCKNTDDKSLFEAIDHVYSGRYYVSAELQYILTAFLTNKNISGKKDQLLSNRELEIVNLIVNGYTNAEIAGKLFLSTRTVDTHRKNVFHKLSINNTASLVRYVLENKIFLGLT